jgi:hypothetical protein
MRPAGRRTAGVEREPDGGRRDPPADDEVSVERGPAVLRQGDLEPVVPLTRADRVRWRLGRAARYQRVADQQAQRHADGRRRLGHVDGDPRRVGHAPVGAQVPRRDDGREPPLPGARVVPPEALVDRELGDDLGAGRDVPQFLGEEARPVLLEQRRRLSLQDGLLEALARDRPPVDLADDPALSDPEGEARHGPVDRERQEVGDVERLGVGVPEALLQHHPDEAASGLRPQGGVLEGKRAAIGGDKASAGRRGRRARGGLDRGSLTHGQASFRLTPSNAGTRQLVTRPARTWIRHLAGPRLDPSTRGCARAPDLGSRSISRVTSPLTAGTSPQRRSPAAHRRRPGGVSRPSPGARGR